MFKGNHAKVLLVIIALMFTSFSVSGCEAPGFISSMMKKPDSLVLSGTVESTQIDANAEVPGKVIKVDKEEGVAVKKGEVLAVIDSSAQELAVKQSEALVKLKQARLDELRAGTRTEQIKQAEASVRTAETSVNSARTAVDNAKINYDYWVDKYNKVKALRESNVSSESDLQDAQYRMDTAYQQLVTAQKQYATTQSQVDTARAQLELLQSGNTNQAIQAAQADLEQAQAALEQAKLILSKYQVKSPIDGTYMFKNINIGDMVNTGTSVGTVSDLDDLWLRVYIPQRHMNLVKLNQELNLKTISLPDKTIKGRIIYIASEAEFTPKNTETSEAKENTVFKLKIKLLDNIDKLKPGMTVDAYIPYTVGK